MVSVTVSHEVRHAGVISAAKALTVRISLVARNVGMTVLVAVVHVRSAVIVNILTRAFDPVVKTLPLDLPPFLRWRIPTAAILSIVIVMFLGQGGGLDRAWYCDPEKNSKRGYYQSIENHDSCLLFSRPSSKSVARQGTVPRIQARGRSLLLRCGFAGAGRLSQQVFQGGAQAGLVVSEFHNDGRIKT
jgi:hypothetical protein